MSEGFARARTVLARIADAVGVVLLIWLGWQVMFGGSQPFENRALWIGLVGVAACWADPGAIKKAPWPMLIYVASALLSAAVQGWPRPAGGPGASWLRLFDPAFYLIVMAVFVYGVAHLARTPLRLAGFVVLLVATTCVLAVQILFDRVSANYFYIRAGSTSLPSVAQWAGLHQTGLVLMLAFPMVFAAALVRPPRALFAASLLLAAGLLTVAHFNGSRSALIVMVLTAITMIVAEISRRGSTFRTRVLLGVVAICLAAGFVAFVATRTAALRPSASLTGERGAIWQAAGSIFLDHAWLGVGPGNYSVAMVGGGYAERYLPGYPESSAGVEQAHNLFLQAAAETGIVGLLCLVVFLAWLIRSSWRAWSTPDGPVVACGILFALIAFLMRSLADNFLDLQITSDRIRVLVWMLFAAALALEHRRRVTAA